jgi:hypothetical protein
MHISGYHEFALGNKSVPVPRHAIKECGEEQLRRHSYLTSALGVVSDQLYAPTALPPGKEFPVPTELDTGWTPGLIWTFWWRDIPLACGGNRTTLPWGIHFQA